MSDLLQRTRRVVPPAVGGRASSAVLPALLAALWVAVISSVGVTVVVLTAWAADTRSGAAASSAIRTGEAVLLLAQGASIHLGAGTFSVIPLGLTALPAWLLMRAGGSVARVSEPATIAAALPGIVSLALGYGALGLGAGTLAGTGGFTVDPVRSFAGPALLALVVGGYGALREAGLRRAAWSWLPAPLRPVVRGSAAAVALIIAAGAVLTAVSLLLSAQRAESLVASLGPGFFGGIVLVLASAAFAPTAAIWGAGVVTGPGFSIGAGTAVGAFHTSLGPVPALPLLAALPERPVPYLWLLLAVPLLAGLAAGSVVGRSAESGDELNGTLLRALCCAPVAGGLMALWALLAAGSAGAGRFAHVGPSPWQVGVAVAAAVALPAVIGCWWAIRRAE